jgi:hypothetical protein
MRPLYRVIKPYKASFPHALIAEKGDKVSVGREDREMKGWYWCKDVNGMKAWIPETHFDTKGSEGVFNQPYNSIEHTVELDEIVQYLGESLGWTECLNKEWKYGWIPSEKLEAYSSG